MFYSRVKELNILKNATNSNKRAVVLLYGKRRVGKSTLIKEAMKNYDGVYLNFTCVKSTFQGNMILLSKCICETFEMPKVMFETLDDAFSFIKKQNKKVCVVIDEYQFLKETLKKGEVDSYLQIICDSLPSNVKLILCGSYISIMKELLEEGNPLFGRFTDIIHLEEMDYYDSSSFYKAKSVADKILLYSVFGGSPFVLEYIDYKKSIKENIIEKLIKSNSVLRTHIESVMLSEIRQAFDIRILEAIGNGKVKYNEIVMELNEKDNGYLDKQIKALIKMETISKLSPINKQNDKKKAFYEMNDNLMRFYFTYIFSNESIIDNIGENAFYSNYIESKLNEYVSKRFEKIAKQYFARCSREGKVKGVIDIGSYWYDDYKNHKNGQFDCVLKLQGGYKIYEVKNLKGKMTKKMCDIEISKIKSIDDLNIIGIGMVSTMGFDFKDNSIDLIEGKELYK